MNWPTLGYQPVLAVAERLQMRQLRTARRTMLRVFKQRSDPSTPLGEACIGFAERLQALHDDSKLTGEQKRTLFEVILNEYAAALTGAPAQPVAQANNLEMEGGQAVGVPDSGRNDNNLSEGDGGCDGVRTDDEGSVSALEATDVGE